MRWTPLLLLIFIVLVAACAPNAASTPLPDITLIPAQALPTSSIEDPVLRQGQFNYDRYCMHCHGFDGEGQIGESAEATRNLGMKVVPAHDSTGVTWQYADQVLLRMTKEGIINGLNRYPMPGFGTTLTDEEIMGLYAYIKTWWTDEQRAYQAEITANLQATYDELGVTPAASDPIVTLESLEATPLNPTPTESLGFGTLPTVTPRP